VIRDALEDIGQPCLRIDVHVGMTDQRNSLLGRLGPDKTVAL